MKYTRKEIIKNAGLASLTLLTPSLITVLLNYIKKDSKIKKIFEEQNEEFEETLNDYVKLFSKHDLKLDVLLINKRSINEYDFVFLAYNREKYDAPLVVIPKIDDYYPDSKRMLDSDVRILRRFSQKHGIYIHYETNKNIPNKLIKKIKDCGELNCIADDLFRPVSFIYAAKYKYENRFEGFV